jgi:DNA-binding IclR family transcriptional regulator
MADALDEDGAKVLEFIRTHSGVTRTDLCRELKMIMDDVNSAVHTLLHRGLITVVERTDLVRYQAKKT